MAKKSKSKVKVKFYKHPLFIGGVIVAGLGLVYVVGVARGISAEAWAAKTANDRPFDIPLLGRSSKEARAWDRAHPGVYRAERRSLLSAF